MVLYLLDLPRKAIPLEEISFTLSPERKTFTPDIRTQHQDEILALYQRCRETNPQFDTNNNLILAFDALHHDHEQRTFALSSVEFRDYFALKHLIAKNRTDHRLFQQFVVLSMIAVLETADHHLVFGHRGGEHLPNRYLPPAGFQQTPKILNPAYFAHNCYEEFAEEVGLHFDGQIYYLGLTGDTRDSFLDVTNFLGRTTKTSTEIENLFWATSKALKEHAHLIYIPADPDHVCSFLRGTYSGVVNSHLDIAFTNGRCTRGPPDIKNRPYQQIENGVGALVSYLALSLSSHALDDELKHLTRMGSIEGVVTKDFTRATTPYLVAAS